MLSLITIVKFVMQQLDFHENGLGLKEMVD